jgi:hypothetical protein
MLKTPIKPPLYQEQPGALLPHNELESYLSVAEKFTLYQKEKKTFLLVPYKEKLSRVISLCKHNSLSFLLSNSYELKKDPFCFDYIISSRNLTKEPFLEPFKNTLNVEAGLHLNEITNALFKKNKKISIPAYLTGYESVLSLLGETNISQYKAISCSGNPLNLPFYEKHLLEGNYLITDLELYVEDQENLFEVMWSHKEISQLEIIAKELNFYAPSLNFLELVSSHKNNEHSFLLFQIKIKQENIEYFKKGFPYFKQSQPSQRETLRKFIHDNCIYSDVKKEPLYTWKNLTKDTHYYFTS